MVIRWFLLLQLAQLAALNGVALGVHHIKACLSHIGWDHRIWANLAQTVKFCHHFWRIFLLMGLIISSIQFMVDDVRPQLRFTQRLPAKLINTHFWVKKNVSIRWHHFIVIYNLLHHIIIKIVPKVICSMLCVCIVMPSPQIAFMVLFNFYQYKLYFYAWQYLLW